MTRPGELPSKLFFRIGEVAGLVGVEPHVLRYWEREFRSIRPTKSAKGQRVYSRKDVENLLRVRDLLYRDGFTIAGAKKKLQRGDEPVANIIQGAVEMGEPDQGARAQAEAVERAPSVEPPASFSPQEVPGQDGPVSSPRVREKLVALRSEVEEFLVELSTGRR
jgi:DNA-binding transcriptional MerR regulator